MGQIHYSFDPTRGLYEIKDLFDLLHRYFPNIPDDPKKIGVPSSSDSEKDKTIRDLNEAIKRHQKEHEKNRETITDLEQKLKDAEGMNKIYDEDTERLSKQVKEKIAENEKLIAEHANKEIKLMNDFKEEKSKIEQEHQSEIQKLNKEIEQLIKKLNIYEPSLNGDTGSDKYFNVEGPNLGETLSADAPFIGKVDMEGQTIFNFNVEKGPHKYFSQHPEELDNYCEIIDSLEGANHIGLGEWGQGKYHNGLLVVTKKAKIKLVRE